MGKQHIELPEKLKRCRRVYYDLLELQLELYETKNSYTDLLDEFLAERELGKRLTSEQKGIAEESYAIVIGLTEQIEAIEKAMKILKKFS